MDRPSRSIRPWIVFAGCVLVVAVLDWAQAVLLPVAVALLLTFLLNPPVSWLQRLVGRTVAVLVVVTLTFTALAGLGWVLTRQITSLAAELPQYRQTFRQKVLDVRRAVRGGPVEKMQSTFEDLKEEIASTETGRSRPATPVVVLPDSAAGLGLPAWVTGLSTPLAEVGLIAVLLIFMLLEHRDMRDRVVRLMGEGHLVRATKTFDDAAERLSRFLLMQSLINLIYGVAVAGGLWWLGVPYPALWGALGAVLRFIPYVGPWIAAGAPLLVSFVTLPDWQSTMYVALLFIALELFTNLVLETVLYAGAAGVTQVALIIAVAFWTWLWGPMGLLLATPLTVCLVVLGKHVSGFRLVATLMADEPVLTPDARFYQRLLAREPADARDIVTEALRDATPREVYRTVVRPAFALIDRDRRDGLMGADQAAAISDMARDIARETRLNDAETDRQQTVPAAR
jgi:predicted PurR-regulated permease PerM